MRTTMVLTFLLLACVVAFADAVDIGASGSAVDNQSGYAFDLTRQQLATQFSLDNTTTVSSVWAAISYCNVCGGQYTLAIMDQLVGGTTYWTSPDTAVSSPTFTTSFTLAPGSYFLMGSTSGTGMGTWQQTTGTYTQVGGSAQTVGFWFDHKPQGWYQNMGAPMAFEIKGTSEVPGSEVPEPGSLLSLGTGMAALAGVVGRKLHR